MFGGYPLVLSRAEVNFYIREGYIKHKEGSENGEMEYTGKYRGKDSSPDAFKEL